MNKLWVLTCAILILSSSSSAQADVPTPKADVPTPQEAQALWLANYKREHADDLDYLVHAVQDECWIHPQAFAIDVSHVDPDVVKQVSNDLKSKGWTVKIENVPFNPAKQVMHVTSPLKVETE